MQILLPLLPVITLLLTVLFTQARLSFCWDGKTVQAKIVLLFFSWPLLPQKKKQHIKTEHSEKSFPLHTLHRIWPLLRLFLRHLRIKRLHLDLTFGSPDAAKTALHYSTAIAVAAPLTKILIKKNRSKNISIHLRPDFAIPQTTGTAEGELRIRPVFLLFPLLRIATKGR